MCSSRSIIDPQMSTLATSPRKTSAGEPYIVVVSQQVYFQADDAAVRLYAHGDPAVFSHAAFRPART